MVTEKEDLFRVCGKCKCEVVFDKDLVSDGYYCACLNCDEDLFSFETDLVENSSVKMLITSDYKENYRRNNCLL